MDPGLQWYWGEEPELVEELAEAKAHKEWPFSWPGSVGWKPHVRAVKPLEQTKEHLLIANTMAEKEQMEKEAARFINRRSSRGDWVMHQRTTGKVEDFDRNPRLWLHLRRLDQGTDLC